MKTVSFDQIWQVSRANRREQISLFLCCTNVRLSVGSSAKLNLLLCLKNGRDNNRAMMISVNDNANDRIWMNVEEVWQEWRWASIWKFKDTNRLKNELFSNRDWNFERPLTKLCTLKGGLIRRCRTTYW